MFSFSFVSFVMSQVPYSPLIDTMTANDLLPEPTDHLCRVCKNRLLKKQPVDHSPTECLTQRCEFLENEVMRLKDHDMKSRIQIKELEAKFLVLEEAVQGLTAPKQPQAAPFNFSSGQKLRNPFKKAFSVDTSAGAAEGELNFDNILPPKRSGSRERVGLFGSLGASSQQRY